jgi:hypothetical protein
MSRLSAPFWFVAAALAVTPAAAQVQGHRLVALAEPFPSTNGTPVPGVPGGTMTQFTGGFGPTIGMNGHVAFGGQYVTGTTGGGGLFTWDGATLTTVATNSTVAPGTGGATFGFSANALGPPVGADGRVGFSTGYRFGTTDGEGVFTASGATITAAALGNPGTVAPVAGWTLQRFSNATMNPGGRLAFVGSGAASIPNLQEGIHTWANGTLATVAHSGQTFAPNRTFATDGNFSHPSINASGTLAFSMRYVDTSTTPVTGGSSVFLATPTGVLTEVLRTGVETPAPGLPGYTVSSVNGVRLGLNNAGHVAFTGSVSLTTGGGSGTGLFTNAGGTLRPVAVTGLTLDPRRNSPLASVADFALNGDGRVTFFATVGSGAYSTTGLYQTEANGGALRALAVPGDSVPGVPGTLEWVGFLVHPPYALSVNAGGQVAFMSGLTGTDQPGVFLAEPNGVLRGVAYPGQVWDLDGQPGGETRVVRAAILNYGTSGGQDGFASSLNDLGQLALTLQFTDNTSGIYVVNLTPIPEPATVFGVAVAGLAAAGVRRLRRR